MKVLVVKLTSMGDVLHLMPALSDLMAVEPNVTVDWMVEGSFAEIPTWHPSVNRVVKVSTRRWRSLRWQNLKEFFAFVKELRSESYDLVVDAQGLMKSAAIARFAKLNKGGTRAGFSGRSIKESPAAKLYHQRIDVDRQQHAIDRLRQLFAGIFNYSLLSDKPDYSVRLPKQLKLSEQLKSRQDQNTIMLFHGTTWATKHLPDQLWREIADSACDDGYKVLLTWGNEAERTRANWIAELRPEISVLDRSTLSNLAQTIASVDGAIAVDTGLGHMAAALGVPCVSVYGSTNAALTGAKGENQSLIQSEYACSPCLLKSCPKLVLDVDSSVNSQTAKNLSTPPCYAASKTNAELSAVAIWKRLSQQMS